VRAQLRSRRQGPQRKTQARQSKRTSSGCFLSCVPFKPTAAYGGHCGAGLIDAGLEGGARREYGGRQLMLSVRCRIPLPSPSFAIAGGKAMADARNPEKSGLWRLIRRCARRCGLAPCRQSRTLRRRRMRCVLESIRDDADHHGRLYRAGKGVARQARLLDRIHGHGVELTMPLTREPFARFTVRPTRLSTGSSASPASSSPAFSQRQQAASAR
jgi:hypothetical protein